MGIFSIIQVKHFFLFTHIYKNNLVTHLVKLALVLNLFENQFYSQIS